MRWVLLLTLFLTACGADMSIESDGSAWSVYRQRDFSGGENLSLIPDAVQQNQFARLENTEIAANGYLQNIAGIVAITSGSWPGTILYGAWDFQKSDGSRYLIINNYNTLYFVAWDGTGPKGFASFTSGIAFTANGGIQAVQWRDVIIFCNGYETPVYFNGTTFATLTGAPKLYCPKIHKEKLWGIDGDNPTHICFSGAGSYTSWAALDFVTIDMGQGDIITQISPQPGVLIVFTENDNAAIYGSMLADVVVELHHFPDKVGCLSVKPGAVLDQGFVFAISGIYKFNSTQIEKLPNQDAFFTAANMLARWSGRIYTDIFRTIGGAYDYTKKRAIFVSTNRWYDARAKVLHIANLASGDDCYGMVTVDDGTTSQINLSYMGSIRMTNIYEFKLTGLQPYSFFALFNQLHIVDTLSSAVPLAVIIQTRHEDFGIEQEKHFRAFTLNVNAAVNAVTLKYSLNGATLVTVETRNLVAGENTFWLNNVRGESISFEITTANQIAIKEMIWKFRPVGRVMK